MSATALEARSLTEAASELSTLREGWPPTRTGTLSGVPVLFTVSGIGKANAAAAVAALAACGAGRGAGRGPAPGPARAFVQVGVGGAYPDTGLELGQVALAATETDLDLGVGEHPKWSDLQSMGIPGVTDDNRIDLRSPLLGRVADTIGLEPVDFATSDSVTATTSHARYLRERFSVAVESMEGAGAARAAAALGVPFIEVRGVSNVVGERDRSAWRLADAVDAACRVVADALPDMWEVVR